MRTLLGLLVLSALPSFAAERMTFGPGAAQCLLPNADVSNTNWTLTGAATVFDATNDPTSGSCAYGALSDGDTTRIDCVAGVGTCTAVVDLANTSGLSSKQILYVKPTAYCKRSSTGSGAQSVTYTYVIGGVDYATSAVGCGAGAYQEITSVANAYTSPATGVAWTSSELDGLRLKITTSGNRTISMSGLQIVVAYDTPLVYGTPRERSGGGN